ncbi:MAG TPA: hypothetical protein VF447_10160, partial [Terriglobales bacterium]
MRLVVFVLCVLVTAGNGASSPKKSPPTNSATHPTFYKDVLPILQQHCQVCHRPGEIAPFSLMTFQETKH